MMDLKHLEPTFGDFLQYFKDIDFEAFLIMKPDHIKEAIPSLGLRIKFESLYMKYLAGIEEVIVMDKPIQKDLDLFDEMDTGETSFDINQILTIPIPKTQNEIMLTSSSGKKIDAQIDYVSPQNKIEVMFPRSSEEKTYLQTAEDILNIPSIELKIVIHKSIIKKMHLEPHERTVIAKAIIHHLLLKDFNREIARPEFIRLSKLIVEAFPMEDQSTFYIPAYKNDPAQGKLFVQYTNYKAQSRRAGLCKKRQYIPKRNDEGICVLQMDDEPNETDEIALKNTFEISENLELIRKFWETSYFERKKLLLELTTDDYLNKFPAFNLYNGYELFILDADKILGQRRSQLPEIAQKILIYANRQRRPSPELKTILLDYQTYSQQLQGSDLTDFDQLTALKLLPYVMANTTKKLSKSEASSYFLPFFKTAFESDTFRKNYFKPSESFPRLMLIGDFVKPSVSLYVSDKHYVIENPIKGFEVLFRAFISLNCDFPIQSRHVWDFVQKVIFDFPTSSGKRVASVETFMQDIRKITIA